MELSQADILMAFKNMDLFTHDSMISSLRPELTKGVFEAMQVFDKEINRLRRENSEMEMELGLEANKKEPTKTQIATTSVPSSHVQAGPVSNSNLAEKRENMKRTWVRYGDSSGQSEESRRLAKKDNKPDTNNVLLTPSGPIEIGRPYPVYMICRHCNIRVLTVATEEDSDQCCNCSSDGQPETVIHTCSVCGRYLGVYQKRTWNRKF